ncbi:MAG TPA: hypothetical protein VKY65_03835 [Alphaproteobacteria bacterium]|nr:hypothetical protein [Alphaproteobacteria bacterium]
MKALRSLIRLHRARLDERRRELVALESQRAVVEAERERMERELLEEQRAARGSLEGGWAYARYARRVLERRAGFAARLAELDELIAQATAAVAAAYQELKRYDVALDNHRKRLRGEAERRHQAIQDEIALTMYRRREAEGT